ncbi:hypothetical protein HYH03_010148 [Edaphochlamys debaryana]|uniref:Uncharacterized protein n=1 Tax=Edaphochlamys debaryana TaxID=47281 RepID=A0A835XWP3_9CHLO|nr:hypothetical protein HYH03_010148 [Edaphochlamys debaryana]|eukprot:KAG2491581.1 hypothetical protein HYH03_010148 [Edaphochlamys debaryana]
MSGTTHAPRRALHHLNSAPLFSPRRLGVQLSAVKDEPKTTSGRKTSSSRPGTASTRDSEARKTTSGRKTESNRAATSPPPRQQSSQQQPQRAPKQPQQQQNGRKPAGAAGGNGGSHLDGAMRRHPLFSRFYDTTLLLGDCVMIVATEASSERIEWSAFPPLVGVMLAAWVAAGAWNGDYSPSGTRAHDDVPWQLSMFGPTYGAVLGAALTWAFASTAAVAAYAGLVAAGLLAAGPIVEDLNTEDLSPQLEVIVALLVTMTCWRGIAAKLRPMPEDKD